MDLGAAHRGCTGMPILSGVRPVAPGTSVGDLFTYDDGSGELKSAVWHLVWAGHLHIDHMRHDFVRAGSDSQPAPQLAGRSVQPLLGRFMR